MTDDDNLLNSNMSDIKVMSELEEKSADDNKGIHNEYLRESSNEVLGPVTHGTTSNLNALELENQALKTEIILLKKQVKVERDSIDQISTLLAANREQENTIIKLRNELCAQQKKVVQLECDRTCLSN